MLRWLVSAMFVAGVAACGDDEAVPPPDLDAMRVDASARPVDAAVTDIDSAVDPPDAASLVDTGLPDTGPPDGGLDPESWGEQRTAVILVDYLDDGGELPASDYDYAVFESPNSLNAFVAEVSYGRAWLSGSTFGWYSIVGGSDGCFPTTEAIAAADPDIYFPDYDRIVIVSRNAGCTGGFGFSSIGKIDVATDDGLVHASVSVTRIDSLYYTDISRTHQATLTHEMMHGFEMGHANSWDCGTMTVSSVPTDCTEEATCDPFDIMGRRYWATHPSACAKEQAEWLTDDEITNVVSSGTYTLEPYPSTASPRALRVPLASPLSITSDGVVSISAYYLELRQPVGFDDRLFGLDTGAFLAPHPVDIDGIIVRGAHFADGRCATTYLLDMHPGSEPDTAEGGNPATNDFIDSFLYPGETFSDPINGLTIEAMSIEADGSITVQITLE